MKITSKWSHIKGTTSFKLEDFEGTHRIDRLDFLQDCVAEMTGLYNAELRGWFRNFREVYLERNKTENGGYTKEFLASIGVSWPPPKGWKRKYIEEGDIDANGLEY
jgi:hypothetical protein